MVRAPSRKPTFLGSNPVKVVSDGAEEQLTIIFFNKTITSLVSYQLKNRVEARSLF